MVREAVEAGADIIMLDNMSPAEMAEAIRIIDGRAQTECSGNMTIENIKTITALGVDYVSQRCADPFRTYSGYQHEKSPCGRISRSD